VRALVAVVADIDLEAVRELRPVDLVRAQLEIAGGIQVRF